MTLRALLALLIVLALVFSIIVSLYVGALIEWLGNGGDILPLLEWISGPFPIDMAVSLLTGILVSIVFFLIVNALIVRPLRLINRALSAYADHAERIQLPSFASSPREVRNLAAVFNEFATTVESSHDRNVEMSRVKSDFISTAAHQLRTPLTGIRWALEALEKEATTESQKQLVKNAMDKSHDLVAIVGTLLDISSIESGKYAYRFQEADMAALVAEVVLDFGEATKRANVSMTLDVPKALPKVSMDRDRMKWVLNNLIENAIHYTPSGGSVTVSATSLPGRLIVKVRDTGIGIPPSDRNNIFERFYRGGNAAANVSGGNGLGLYIARTIANDHHGDLSFEANTEGTGTTFTLALPVGPQPG